MHLTAYDGQTHVRYTFYTFPNNLQIVRGRRDRGAVGILYFWCVWARKGSYFVDAQYSRMFESVPVLGSGQQ